MHGTPALRRTPLCLAAWNSGQQKLHTDVTRRGRSGLQDAGCGVRDDPERCMGGYGGEVPEARVPRPALLRVRRGVCVRHVDGALQRRCDAALGNPGEASVMSDGGWPWGSAGVWVR